MRVCRHLASICLALVLSGGGIPEAHSQVVMPGLPGVDGNVLATQLGEDRLYLGGAFTHIGVPRGGWAAFDPATGQSIDRPPRVAGLVDAACPDGSGGWYLGGLLHGANGQQRFNVMHVLADGTLSPWAPVVDGRVSDLVLVGSTVYLAGRFTSVSGAPRVSLAAVDAVSGAVLPWRADTDGWVFSLVASGADLFVGGTFQQVSGLPRIRVAKIGLSNGDVRAWDAQLQPDQHPSLGIEKLIIDSGRLLLVGFMQDPTGQSRHFMALDPETALAFQGLATDSVECGAWDMTVYGGRIYLCGTRFGINPFRTNFAAMALDRSTLQIVDWQPQEHDFATGGGLPSSPTAYSVAGAGAKVYLGIDQRGDWTVVPVDTTTGVVGPGLQGAEASPYGIYCMRSQGGILWVSGHAGFHHSESRAYLAELDLRSRAFTSWAPSLPGFVNSLALIGSRLFACSPVPDFQLPKTSGFAFDLITHESLPWYPDSTRGIERFATGAGRLFAAGRERVAPNTFRNWIGELDPNTGQTIGAVIRLNGSVESWACDEHVLYVVGNFDSVGGQFRSRVAAFSVAGFSLMPPLPDLGLIPHLVALSPDQALFHGSPLAPGYYFAAMTRATGQLSTWHPSPVINREGAQAIGCANGGFLFSGLYNTAYFDAFAGPCLYQQSPISGSANQYPVWIDQPVSTIESHDGRLVLGGLFWMAGAWPAGGFTVVTWPSTDVAPGGSRASSALLVYPVPARNQVRFRLPSPGMDRVQIVDLAGRIVLSSAVDPSVNGEWTWGLETARGSRVAPGVHFARFFAGEDLVGVTRFVVIP